MTRGGVAPQLAELGLVELLIVRPNGKVSVIETLVRFVSSGAVTKILNLEFPPAVMELGENDFDANKSVPEMFMLAVDDRGLPTPWPVVKSPGSILFVNVPDGVPAGTVTATVIVQVPGVVGLPCGMTPPSNTIDAEPVLAVNVPPQVFVAVGVAAIISGVGRSSVRCTPV